MNDKSYKFVIPISSSECLEVYPKTTQGIDSESMENSSDLKIFAYENGSLNSFSEVPKSQQLQHEIMRILKVTHQGLSRYFDRHEAFLVATNKGFQLICSLQILYFEYNSPKKQWVVILSDLTCILLKRNTTAQSILDYSSSFIRINHRHILNLNHLVKIDDNECIITVPTHSSELVVSRSYLRNIQETVRMI